jgi:hypothetical protein
MLGRLFSKRLGTLGGVDTRKANGIDKMAGSERLDSVAVHYAEDLRGKLFLQIDLPRCSLCDILWCVKG